jgi:NAD-dependent deacetylase
VTDFRSIVVLTGAGISAESGIRTFRATDGLWEDHRIEEVATPEGFAANPLLVHQFYNARRRQLLDPAIKPNAAHSALAKLEYEWKQRPDHEFLLVTQNVDNLHERAGSQNLIHMHGELLKIRCTATGLVFDHREDLGIDSVCRCCRQPGNLRPHIVWFGEIPLAMPRIQTALSKCDLFVSIGTSGQVYPAAGFCDMAHQAGAHTIEINLESTASEFSERILELASTATPALAHRLLQIAL